MGNTGRRSQRLSSMRNKVGSIARPSQAGGALSRTPAPTSCTNEAWGWHDDGSASSEPRSPRYLLPVRWHRVALGSALPQRPMKACCAHGAVPERNLGQMS